MVHKYLFLLSLLALVCGCSRGAPAVSAPKVDPSTAAAAAIAEYDANSDGKISSTEAKQTALDPKKGWDSDADGSISEKEIADRLTNYEAMMPGIQSMTCRVIYRGRPLPDAEVIFEPESFLGGVIETASGTTDSEGVAEMVAEEVVKKDPTLRGIRAAMYKVRITHGKVKLPPKYNDETTLFFELSPMEMIDPPTFLLK